MQGKLLINLEPSYICFESGEKLRHFKYCSRDDIRRLLIDLKVLQPYQDLPRTDYVVSLGGDFALETLSSYGLVRGLPASDTARLESA